MDQPHLFDNTEKANEEAGLNYWENKFLATLRQEIIDNREEGCQCKICDQNVKLYKRNFNSAMSLVMIKIAEETKALEGFQTPIWIQVENLLKAAPDIPSTARGDFPKAVHWGLLEKQPGERDDGSTRMGFYQITQKGEDFVNGKITIPKWVKLYNKEIIGFAEDPITIKEALGTKFNYEEMMRGE